jgi:UTP:GlnB (protein PII) uridylyltransferase
MKKALNPNYYRKAIVAFAIAASAYYKATNPQTWADWGKCALAGLIAAGATYFVPNKDDNANAADSDHKG